MHLGAERMIFDSRAGVKAGFISGKDLSKLTFGGSYVWTFSGIDLQLDYSYGQHLSGGITEFGATHNVSTTVRF